MIRLVRESSLETPIFNEIVKPSPRIETYSRSAESMAAALRQQMVQPFDWTPEKNKTKLKCKRINKRQCRLDNPMERASLNSPSGPKT